MVLRKLTLTIKNKIDAVEGEIPEGIVGERIDALHDGKYSCGNILLVNKNIFGLNDNVPQHWNTAINKGDTLSVGNNGYLVVTNQAGDPLIALSKCTFIFNK